MSRVKAKGETRYKTAVVKVITNLDYVHWARQRAEERRKLLKDDGPFSDKELCAWTEGMVEGFLEAVSTLVLHGHAVRELT